MNIFKKSLIFSPMVFMLYTPFALAEVGRKTPNLIGNVSAGPYYNPASRSYFELVRTQSSPGLQMKWARAKQLAEKRIFKKTQGQLAKVTGLATHQFLIKKFSAKNYWIGLQYICNSKELKWVDGSGVTAADFSAWDSQWSNTNIRCGGKGYMPVHYTTATSTRSLRWRASGPNKVYTMYLVEYPTGKE